MAFFCKKKIWSNGDMKNCGLPSHGFCNKEPMCEKHFYEYKEFLINEWRQTEKKQSKIIKELQDMGASEPESTKPKKGIVYLVEQGSETNLKIVGLFSSYDNSLKKVEDINNEYNRKFRATMKKIKKQHKDPSIVDRWSHYSRKVYIRKCQIEDII